ncbi:unnamed protein product [Ixodes persulcatus]
MATYRVRKAGRLFPTPGLQHVPFAFHCAARALPRLPGRPSITEGRRLMLEMGQLKDLPAVLVTSKKKKRKSTLQIMCLGGNKPGFSIQPGETTQSLKNINVYHTLTLRLMLRNLMWRAAEASVDAWFFQTGHQFLSQS